MMIIEFLVAAVLGSAVGIVAALVVDRVVHRDRDGWYR